MIFRIISKESLETDIVRERLGLLGCSVKKNFVEVNGILTFLL